MAEKNVTVVNETGLHARPAAVELVKNGKVANAKSIFNVMSLGISKGMEITVRVNGEDAEAHVDRIVAFISNLTD